MTGMKLTTSKTLFNWIFLLQFTFVALSIPSKVQDGQFNESTAPDDPQRFFAYHEVSSEDTHFVSINSTFNNSGHFSQPCSGLTDPRIFQCFNDLKEDLDDNIYSDCTTCRVHCCVSLKFYHCIRNMDTCGLQFTNHFLGKLFNYKFVFYNENTCGSFKYPSVRCFFYLHETVIIVTLFTFIMVSFTIILVVTLYYKFWQIQKVFAHPNSPDQSNGHIVSNSPTNVTVRLPPTPPPPYSQVKNQLQFPPPPTYEEASVAHSVNCTNAVQSFTRKVYE